MRAAVQKTVGCPCSRERVKLQLFVQGLKMGNLSPGQILETEEGVFCGAGIIPALISVIM